MIQAHEKYHTTNHTLDFSKNEDIVLYELIWKNHTSCTKKFVINVCIYAVAMWSICTGCLPNLVSKYYSHWTSGTPYLVYILCKMIM